MSREVCEHWNELNNCEECGATMYFNIDKTFNIDAEIEKGSRYKVAHLWDESGNCTQERLTVQRWINVKYAIEFLLKDSKSISVSTDCGVTVYRGKVWNTNNES